MTDGLRTKSGAVRKLPKPYSAQDGMAQGKMRSASGGLRQNLSVLIFIFPV